MIVLAVALSNRSKDDDNSSPASLIGTWKLTSLKVNGTPQQLDKCALKILLKFTDTKITRTVYKGEDCLDADSRTFNYTRNGDTFTDEVDGEIRVVELINLAETTLEIKQVEEYDNSIHIETYTLSGIVSIFTIDGFFYLF